MQKRYVTVENDNGGTQDGQVTFASLVQQGALSSDGNGGFDASGGFDYHWDSCSSTVSKPSPSSQAPDHQPWLQSWDTDQVVTFDDPSSMSLKAQFAAQAGLRGCNMFSIDGDFTNDGNNWSLANAVRSGLGL